MSFWGLCSAWSVPLWLQSDSLLEEFNLHHTPHRSSLRHHPYWLVSAWSEMHLGFKMDSSGESDASAILFQKRNIIFNFLWFRALYIVAQLSYRGGQTQCRNYLTHWRADFDPICQPSQRYPSSLSVKSAYHREKAVREMHHRNWTWNAISLLATEVQVDWGLSLQILISCLGIGEHGLSSLLEMMQSPSFWQLKSVHLAPLLCSIMVIYEEGQGFNKSHRAIYILSVPSLLYSIMKCSSSNVPRGKHSFLLRSLAWKKHCIWFKGQVQSAVETMWHSCLSVLLIAWAHHEVIRVTNANLNQHMDNDILLLCLFFFLFILIIFFFLFSFFSFHLVHT